MSHTYSGSLSRSSSYLCLENVFFPFSDWNKNPLVFMAAKCIGLLRPAPLSTVAHVPSILHIQTRVCLASSAVGKGEGQFIFVLCSNIC